MKKTIFFIFLVFICYSIARAHGPNDHKEKKKESNQRDSSRSPEQENQMDIGRIDKEEVKLLLDRKDNKAVTADFKDFPTLHPLVVHFPLVLLIVAVFTQLASFIFYKKELSFVTFVFLVVGFAGAYVAATFVHPHTEGLDDFALRVLREHELYADLTLWSSGIAMVVKTASHFFLQRKLGLEFFLTVVIFASAYFVSMAGHHGTQLAYIEGVGPKGQFLEIEH